jgi:hypothetical protein
LRILISSVKLLQQEQILYSAAAVSVFATGAACCGAVVVKFSISLLMIRPFSPEPLLDLIEFLYR